MTGPPATIRTIAIQDLDDPRLAPYRDVRDADLRGSHGLYIVESEACIARWLAAIAQRRHAAPGAPPRPPVLEVHSLLLTEESMERLRHAIACARAGPVFIAPRELIERTSGYDHHHGSLGMGRRVPDPGVDALVRPLGADDDALVLVTDGVVHVDNMGSIFRNAAAFAAAGVICSSDSADPLMRKTVRISMGHVFTVPWTTAADLPAALERLRESGFRVVVAEDEPGAAEISAVPFEGRVAVVFGAEGRGVARSILERADLVARIPTEPGVPLNVAVASAIVLHEARRAERSRGARG